MGCGASAEPGKTGSAETSLKALEEPVVPVDPSKFTSISAVFRGRFGVVYCKVDRVRDLGYFGGLLAASSLTA